MKKLIVTVSMAALLFIVVWTFCYTTGHITQKGYTLARLHRLVRIRTLLD